VSVTARWWRVPAAEVRGTGGGQAKVDWLYDWWQRIDAWITEQHAGPAGSFPQPSRTA